MPPHTTDNILPLQKIQRVENKEKDNLDQILNDKTYRTVWGRFKTPLIWGNIIGITLFHIYALYKYVTFPYLEKPALLAWSFLMGWLSGLGVTAGAHRLWTHHAYKAKLPLRIILGIGYSMAGHNRLVDWVKDHRVHHKFSETDADPHNSNRGFFFAHVGWLMMKKHPEVIRKGRQLDFSDLMQDPVVVFIEKHFWSMKMFWCFIFPSLVPYYCWNESLHWSICANLGRYLFVLNSTWLVNSAAHIYGNRPFDKNIQPTENRLVSILAMGEGWHNYHHSFPWDYRAAEIGPYSVNPTALLLDVCSKFGWAYDLKSPSDELVQKFIDNRGDGTHKSKIM